MIVSSPGIFERAAHEIRGIFTEAEDITATSTANLVYFKACIEEDLRMYPPLVGSMPRVVLEGGATICC
jgi:cytochrome P450